jgi:hypothetical protein
LHSSFQQLIASLLKAARLSACCYDGKFRIHQSLSTGQSLFCQVSPSTEVETFTASTAMSNTHIVFSHSPAPDAHDMQWHKQRQKKLGQVNEFCICIHRYLHPNSAVVPIRGSKIPQCRAAYCNIRKGDKGTLARTPAASPTKHMSQSHSSSRELCVSEKTTVSDNRSFDIPSTAQTRIRRVSRQGHKAELLCYCTTRCAGSELR